MIGQKNVLERIDKTINSFPHFIIIIGSSGSGKKTLAREIAYKISCVYTACSVAVDAVREVIDSSYQSQTKVLYCFPDADTMSVQAKNALLKITEEPPQFAYFCLTITDESSLLDTIKSRGFVIRMDAYTPEEIYEYAKVKTGFKEYSDFICDVCETPGDVELLCSYDIGEFKNYVELVMDNIAEVQPANAFKSSGKLALKTDEGYDLKLFWSAFIQVCLLRIYEENRDTIKYSQGILVTEKYFYKLYRKGANKQQIYDAWVFAIREVW